MRFIKRKFNSLKLFQCLKKPIKLLLFRITRNPKWGIRYAKSLMLENEFDRAISAYEEAFRLTNQNRRFVSTKQKYQFIINKELTDLQHPKFVDPLCTLEIGYFGKAAGTYSLELRPFGLRVKGYVNKHAFESQLPESVGIFLEDVLIRKESIFFNHKRASFSFTIPRPTLTHFPKQGKLQVKTMDGTPLLIKRAGSAQVVFKSGSGNIFQLISKRGLLDKKGYIQLTSEQIRFRQDAYLKVYNKARKAFDEAVGTPLFLMYGTLLGVYRSGDFIPGDDDFDVGYVSDKTEPVAVKKEVTEIIKTLIRTGFTVIINQKGKPFRLRDAESGPDIHLDVRPLWLQDEKVWAHKQACLPMDIEGFARVKESSLRGVKVYVPVQTERFLELYYGSNWRIPDPGYSNKSTSIPKNVKNNLKLNCLEPEELLDLHDEIKNEKVFNKDMGDLICLGIHDLYPIEMYEKRCGF